MWFAAARLNYQRITLGKKIDKGEERCNCAPSPRHCATRHQTGTAAANSEKMSGRSTPGPSRRWWPWSFGVHRKFAPKFHQRRAIFAKRVWDFTIIITAAPQNSVFLGGKKHGKEVKSDNPSRQRGEHVREEGTGHKKETQKTQLSSK